MESVGTTASNPTNPLVEQPEVAPDSTEEPAQVGQYERKTKGMFMSLELAPTQKLDPNFKHRNGNVG